MPQILQDNGWSTFWLGKDHNVPEQDIASGATRKQWPLQQGFDRFYGFLGGETNQWYPDLVDDNKFIDQPYSPEEGYHLSKDLADQALRMLRDHKATNPSRPWYMWFCPGANHAPHHCPQEYIDKYKGKFDDGYEAYREWVLPRMIEKGILPKGTQLTPLNPLPGDVSNAGDMVRPWDSLNADEKKLFSRLMEVYAGFSEYTDAQVGRIIDYLEQTGQLDNTVVIYAADNGASGEGSPNGSVNENKFFNGYPDELAENLKLIDRLGGPDTYEHYPTGWAAATSTPFKMFKRYSEYAGGTCDPLVISLAEGHQGARRGAQPVPPLAPTSCRRSSTSAGWRCPRSTAASSSIRSSGVSMRYTFDAPTAPTQKKRQYYAMLGTRGDLGGRLEGRRRCTPRSRARATSTRTCGSSITSTSIRAESKDLAKEHPEKLQALIKAWFEEADKNLVLPLDDRTALEQLNIERPSDEPPRERYVYYPGTSPVPEGVAVNVRGRSYKILADVEITDPNCSGVIFAHGSRFGGHSLFIKDKKLHYVYNFLGIQPEQQFVVAGAEARQVHARHGVHAREGRASTTSRIGTTKLYVNDKVVAEGPMRTQVGKFTLSGDGLCVGRDSGDAVSQRLQVARHVQGRHHPRRRRHGREGAVPRPREDGGGGVRGRLATLSRPPFRCRASRFHPGSRKGHARSVMTLIAIAVIVDAFAERFAGPLKFRLVLQPLMATYLAIRHGLQDAKTGQEPYYWSIFTSADHRRALLAEGWKDVGKLYILAVVLDAVYQFIVMRWVYPLDAMGVAGVLAFVPYVVLRGLVTRLAKRK